MFLFDDALLFLLAATALCCAVMALMCVLAEPALYRLKAERALALSLKALASPLLTVAGRTGHRGTTMRTRTLWRDLLVVTSEVTYRLGWALLRPVFAHHGLAVHAGAICTACSDGAIRNDWSWDVTVDCLGHACKQCDRCLAVR